MDMTGQELRNADIRESVRGYQRDEVSALLERAATTIDHLHDRLRGLQERRLAPRSQASGRPRGEDESSAAAAERADIAKALLGAQRTADELIAAAGAKAQELMSESEAKAASLVDDAQSVARRARETERRQIETEILDLSEKRDALTSDADALERFAAQYQERIRDAIEAELASIQQARSSDARHPPLVT
jgi:cell division initiation protein